MLLFEPNSPRSVQPHLACFRRVSPFGISFAFSVVLCGAIIFGVPVSRAQEQQSSSTQQNDNVADAARQERARKQEEQKAAKHVYTDEDLKRARILTPEDQAKVEARKNPCGAKNNCAPAPGASAPAPLDADGQDAQPSLGEIARQLREQKEWEALKPKQLGPFHLSMDNPVLASPIIPEHSPLRPPVAPVLRSEPRPSENRTGVFRRDPFARVPTRPRTAFHGESQLRPATPPPSRSSSSAAPKISSGLIAPNALPWIPAQPPRPSSELPAAKSESRVFKFQPVHPSAPIHPRGSHSTAAPSGIFSRLQPVAPLAAAPAHPAAPAESVNPSRTVTALSPSISPMSASQQVRVQPGDSLWSIARRILGRGTLWTVIASANPSVAHPSRLHIGDSLVVPARPPAVAVAAPSTALAPVASGHTVEVHEGDTLWSLAQAHLGHAANWHCLAAANPAVRNPDRIFAGQSLALPASCADEQPSGSRHAK